MARQTSIQGAIDQLRYSNEVRLSEISDHSDDIAFQTRSTKILIGAMLDGMAIDRQRGQDNREGDDRGDRGGPSGGGGTPPPAPQDNGSFGLVRILGGIVAGLTGAVLGLVAGIVKTITRPFTELAKSTKDFFKNTKLVQFVQGKFASMITTIKDFFKPVANFFSNISKAFKAGLRGETRAVRGAMGRFVSLQRGITGFFASIGRMTNKFILRPFNRIRRAIGSIGRVMNGAAAQTGRIGQFFSKIGDGFRTVGRLFSGFARTFNVVFRAFAVVGRVIALPITIITGLIGGIKGMFADFTKSREEGDGLLKSVTKGFFGFIKGAVNGIIMMPLDLLKSGIGWIAGKLGFKNFENLLAGFSFAGLFSGLVDGVVNGVFGFFEGYIQIWKDAFKGAIEGFADGGIFGAISGFFGSIATSIKNVFIGLIKKVFGIFEGGDDMFAALGEGIANIKQSIKNFFVGLLPEQGSFLSKFVPDSVYEWAGQPAVSEPEGSELPTESAAEGSELSTEEVAPERGMFEDKVNEGGLAFKADMDKRNAEFEAAYAKKQAELNAMRMDAIQTGDTTKLEKKKAELKPVKSFAEEEADSIAGMKKELKLAEEGKLKLGWTWTDDEIAAETDEVQKQFMIEDNSAEAQVYEQEKLREKIARKEKELAEYKVKQEQKEADIRKFGSVEAGKLSRMSEEKREKQLAKARGMIASSQRGEEVLAINKRRAESLLAAESQRQQSMIVAPSTQVVNNNSSQGIVMNQNMPAVDNLDTTYG